VTQATGFALLTAMPPTAAVDKNFSHGRRINKLGEHPRICPYQGLPQAISLGRMAKGSDPKNAKLLRPSIEVGPIFVLVRLAL
jgi:hypothetical protein